MANNEEKSTTTTKSRIPYKNLNLFTAPETPVATAAARDPVEPEAEAM